MFRPVALVLSLIAPLLSAQEANITQAPRAVNISVGGLAEFNCTAFGNELYWLRNDHQMHNGTNGAIISQTVAIGNIRNSILKIKITSTDNAANITCYAYTDNNPLKPSSAQSTVLLLVQGQLEPAHNLNVVSINSTTVCISWSPPYTLEGVPILGYTVVITNTTSGENETISIEGDTTMLYYTIDHPDLVNNFTVTVICLNMSGAGGKASMKFSISVNPVVSRLQVISSTPVMTSILTQSVTPVFSSTVTASHSVSPDPFTANQPGIIAAVITIILAIAVSAIVCTGVIVAVKYYRGLNLKKQKKTSQEEEPDASYAELIGREGENKNRGDDRAPDQDNILDQETSSVENGPHELQGSEHLSQLLENGSLNQLLGNVPPTSSPLQAKIVPSDRDKYSDQQVSSEESSPEDETDNPKEPLLNINYDRLLSYQPGPPVLLYDTAGIDEYHSLPPSGTSLKNVKAEISKPAERQALLDDAD